MQRWKTHPEIRKTLEGGKRLGYGARALTAGGILSLPKTVFPGGAFVGCEAGYLNSSRIKGSHAALKTGMLAAEAAFDALVAGRSGDELDGLPGGVREELAARGARALAQLQAVVQEGPHDRDADDRHRAVAAAASSASRRRPGRCTARKADHLYLEPAAECQKIVYPKPDNVLTFDRLSSVFVSNTNHAEDQPAHLTLKDASVPVQVNLAKYAGPESRYCPAAVYEFVGDGGSERLQINAQNCVHCKTCDIKDPTQNIVWVTPEGGGGPNYVGM